ncbi:hypothetical protein KKB11_02570, partial [Candidatus Micrarchaeota archaeon]|nr:hypothetical protein [Candidatus Micrarchaeota archaeon]
MRFWLPTCRLKKFYKWLRLLINSFNMCGLLNEILFSKEKEIVVAQEKLPLEEIKSRLHNSNFETRDFYNSLQQAKNVALIAEIKKAS